MKLQSIQVLRGLAAFIVMVFHIRGAEAQLILKGGGTELPLVGGLFTNGYLGVDLFFVISGFIMVFVASASPASPRTVGEFLLARFARIYPVWWLFAAVMTVYLLAAYGLTGLGETGQPAVGRGIPPAEYLVKSFLLAPQSEYPVLAVGWTLVHEIHFYLVFGLILLAPARWRPWLLAVWAGLVITGALMGLSAPVGATLLQLATHPMSLEFILGAAAGYLVTSGRRWRPGLVTAIAVFWLMFAAFFHGADTAFTLLWGRVLWFGLPCALLVYGFASLDVSARLGVLAPVIAGAFAGAVIFQSYGLPTPSPDAVRLQASLIAIAGGAAVCLAACLAGLVISRRPGGLPGFLLAPARLMKTGAATIGDWSYALYLSHVFIVQGLQRVFARLAELPGGAGRFFDVAGDGRTGNITYLAACIVCALIVSWLAYRFFELPMTRQAGKLRRAMFRKPDMRVRPAAVQAAIW